MVRQDEHVLARQFRRSFSHSWCFSQQHFNKREHSGIIIHCVRAALGGWSFLLVYDVQSILLDSSCYHDQRLNPRRQFHGYCNCDRWQRNPNHGVHLECGRTSYCFDIGDTDH